MTLNLTKFGKMYFRCPLPYKELGELKGQRFCCRVVVFQGEGISGSRRNLMPLCLHIWDGVTWRVKDPTARFFSSMEAQGSPATKSQKTATNFAVSSIAEA